MIDRFRVSASALLLVVAGCAQAISPVTPAPSPAPAPAPAVEAPVVIPKATVSTAPSNWQHLDLASDGIAGISTERAMRELLAGRQPKRTVVVAVIDGGVDTAHVDLRANLWTNPK